jgi:hypothetical protein
MRPERADVTVGKVVDRLGTAYPILGEEREVAVNVGTRLTADVPAAVESYVAHVTASGPGAVAVGRDNAGTITTNAHAVPQVPGSAPAGGQA